MDDDLVTPASIELARDAQIRERAAFTIDTGIPLNSDGRLEMGKKKPAVDAAGSTDTFVR